MSAHRRTALRAVQWLLALLLILTGLTLVASPGSATPGVDDYPAKLKKAGRDALVDPWNFYNRECTSFVAWRLNNDNKIAFTNQYKQPSGDRWSNAVLWKPAAQRAGILVNTTPAVGAVAWWSGGRMGHVAWVEKASSTSITIEEYNYVSAGNYSVRTIAKSSSSWPNDFIHVKDLALKSTGAPKVTGTARVGTKLTASAGTWSTSGATYKYQWLAGGAAIAGATASTFTPTAAQYAQKMQVKVTATVSGMTASASSVATAAVAEGPAAAATKAPVISGTPMVGTELTTSAGTWSVTGLKYGYQWLAGGVAVAGATSTSYTPGADALGKAISVRVTAARTGYATGTSTSAPTVVVQPGTIAPTTPPAISGTPQAGVTLAAAPGTWSVSGATYGYQWLADNTVIDGATGSSYTPGPALVGHTLAVKVSAAKPGYRTAAAVSPRTAVIANVAMRFTVAPSIAGTAVVGRVLTARPGAFAPANASVRYQWLANGVPIRGAVGSTHKLTGADLGRHVSVSVTLVRAGWKSVARSTAGTRRVQVTPRIYLRTVSKAHRIRMTVTIKAKGVARPGGNVRVLNGKKVIARGRVVHGRIVLRLPHLKKGRHLLKVAYASGNTIMLARSTTKAVKAP